MTGLVSRETDVGNLIVPRGTYIFYYFFRAIDTDFEYIKTIQGDRICIEGFFINCLRFIASNADASHNTGVIVGTPEYPSAFGTYDLCNTTIKPNCAICDKNKKTLLHYYLVVLQAVFSKRYT